MGRRPRSHLILLQQPTPSKRAYSVNCSSDFRPNYTAEAFNLQPTNDEATPPHTGAVSNNPLLPFSGAPTRIRLSCSLLRRTDAELPPLLSFFFSPPFFFFPPLLSALTRQHFAAALRTVFAVRTAARPARPPVSHTFRPSLGQECPTPLGHL